MVDSGGDGGSRNCCSCVVHPVDSRGRGYHDYRGNRGYPDSDIDCGGIGGDDHCCGNHRQYVHHPSRSTVCLQQVQEPTPLEHAQAAHWEEVVALLVRPFRLVVPVRPISTLTS
jgi:hypothetical protein